MKKMNFQFHSTFGDMCNIISFELHNSDIKLFGVVREKKPQVLSICEKLTVSEYEKYDLVILTDREMIEYKTYRELLKDCDNRMIIERPVCLNNSMTETRIWCWSEKEIYNEWKKIIRELKKSMLKGAWIGTQFETKKVYDQNHYYTENAKILYEQGMVMMAYAGNCIYELKH